MKIYIFFILFSILHADDAEKKEINNNLEKHDDAEKEDKDYYKAQEKGLDEKEVIELLEEFERLCPTNEKVPLSIIQRGEIAYKNGKYEEAIAIFEFFLENFDDDDQKNKVLRSILFCYYSQLSSTSNLELVEESSKLSSFLIKSNNSDEEVLNIHNKLKKYLSYYNMIHVYYAQSQSPFLWGQYLWACTAQIDEFEESVYAQEAMCRIVEFFVNQDEKLHVFALEIYSIMKDKFPDSEYTKLAEDLMLEKNISLDKVK